MQKTICYIRSYTESVFYTNANLSWQPVYVSVQPHNSFGKTWCISITGFQMQNYLTPNQTLAPLLLTWFNFNPSWKSVGWSYLFIPKLQRLHFWSLGLDKKFHSTLSNGCNYLSMLRVKLNHVSKRGPWWIYKVISRKETSQSANSTASISYWSAISSNPTSVIHQRLTKWSVMY